MEAAYMQYILCYINSLFKIVQTQLIAIHPCPHILDARDTCTMCLAHVRAWQTMP